MGKPVANAEAQIQCIHQGLGSIISPGETKLTINGKNAFTNISGTITSCQQPQPKICSKFSITSGTASKLTVGGKPVVLQGDTGDSNGTPPGCEIKNAGQSILQTE